MSRPRLSLNQVFALSLLAAAVLLSVLFTVLEQNSRAAIAHSSGALRDATARRVGTLVQNVLGDAARTTDDLGAQLAFRAVAPDDPDAVESALYAHMVTRPRLFQITFTRATRTGWDADGLAVLSASGRSQVAVTRVLDRTAGGLNVRLVTRRVTRRPDGTFRAEMRERPRTGALLDAPFVAEPAAADDPTTHITFVSAARRAQGGARLWSDLSWPEVDAACSAQGRRVVVTVQQAVEDAGGLFLGVLRVGLVTNDLDTVAGILREDAPQDPHQVFLCDRQGRLVTRLGRGDTVAESGDDLRISSEAAPPAVRRALQLPVLSTVDPAHPHAESALDVDGERHPATFRYLDNTQDWIVGIVVPEAAYLGDLLVARRRMLWWTVGVMAGLLVVGALTLRAVQGGLGRLVESAARMGAFDFTPRDEHPALRDMAKVSEQMEQAKTALRAMGKYVPLGLVRRLYGANREPMLGGETVGLTVMFSDLANFTTLSESMSPDALAESLGLYLDTMTRAIHGEAGIIDKYIGDAVMALWNVPDPCAQHPRRACAAALACLAAERALYASKEWTLPALHTRYGLHTGEAVVGHFGAHERLSYTALGDTINLASRLESLNKQYGTLVLASEAVEAAARDAFAFRLVDRVTVKGRSRGVGVYELLGPIGVDATRARRYEEALTAYFARDFQGALVQAEALAGDDGPSRVLADRCRLLIADPPPADWDGVWVAKSK